MSEKKRIFVCALAQESNTFNPVPMPLSRFYPYELNQSGYDDDRGAMAHLSTRNVECVWGLGMRSNSGGPLTEEAVAFFLDDTVKRITSMGRPDGVLLLLHGATLSEHCDDVCGKISETVRELVGEETVIVGAYDLHANLTEKIMKNMDYLAGYWEYPHIDRFGTGGRAAKLLCDALEGRAMRMARAAVPMLAPASAYTTKEGALKRLNEKAQAMIASGRILEYSVFQVQPWIDTPFSESAVIAIAENEEAAKEAADELARDCFAARRELQGEAPLSMSEIVERALQNKSGKPIVLVDSADSVGAGSTGDSAAVVEALLPYSHRLKAATEVRDPQAVAKAFEVGVGNQAEFTIGAAMAPALSRPVTVKATVKSLHDGVFYANGPMSKGARVWSGRTAVLEVGGLLIRLSELGDGVFDVNYYRSFGIPVELCDLVSVKACTSFKASYEPFVGEICAADTPGAARSTIRALPYKKLPRPTYPFEEITESDIRPARIYR